VKGISETYYLRVQLVYNWLAKPTNELLGLHKPNSDY